jgi:HAD superfamily hydrolase (TIGR01509 family)
VPEPVELVIFDCDGVLVDSERIAVPIDRAVLAEVGWPMSETEVVERFLGRTDQAMADAVADHIGRPLPEGWIEEYQRRYREAFKTRLAAVDGVMEALDQIDVPTCVASSGTPENIRYRLILTGLYPRFDGRIFSAVEVPMGKPAPDLFLHAAKRMGALPSRCAVVEDSRFGVEAARAAGMRAFGYAGGLTPAARLEGSGTVVFGDMRDLPRLLRAT